MPTSIPWSSQAVYNSFVWLIEQIQKQLALIKAPLEAISRLVNQQNNPPPGTAGEAARRATEALGGGTSGAPTPYTRPVAPSLPGSAASTAAGTIGPKCSRRQARLETHWPGQSSLTAKANFATELSKANVTAPAD